MSFKIIKDLIQVEENNFGNSDEQIKSVEDKLGNTLPIGLKKYYKEFGNHKGKIQIFDDIINLEDLEFDKEEFLMFFRDCQTGIRFGVPKEEMKNPSPNVYYKINNWTLDNDDIRESLISLGFQSALTKLPFYAFRWGIENSEEQKVYNNFEKLNEELRLWNSKFFQSQPNEIIGLTKSEGKTNLYVAANNPKDFLRIKSIFKDDWYNRENQFKKMKEKYKK